MRPYVLALPILLFLGAAPPSAVSAGVKYGDAVPGVVYPSDIERIKRLLHLDRFSLIAAARLGAEEGREVVVAEPLSDETLKMVREACDAGGFCPDPTGFVASRIRVVLLQGGEVGTLLTVQTEARGERGRLVDLRALGISGEILGWSGLASASEGHLALSLTPITAPDGGRVRAGLDPPLLLRFNVERGRFQAYDCVAADDGGADCDFLDETGN